jgi:hypothetical protein
MTRKQALEYVSYCVDSALSERRVDEMPANARLVGWQCGFEPMVVAVWSYFDGVKLTEDEAAEIAIDLLLEHDWFTTESVEPDFII